MLTTPKPTTRRPLCPLALLLAIGLYGCSTYPCVDDASTDTSAGTYTLITLTTSAAGNAVARGAIGPAKNDWGSVSERTGNLAGRVQSVFDVAGGFADSDGQAHEFIVTFPSVLAGTDADLGAGSQLCLDLGDCMSIQGHIRVETFTACAEAPCTSSFVGQLSAWASWDAGAVGGDTPIGAGSLALDFTLNQQDSVTNGTCVAPPLADRTCGGDPC